MGPDEVKARLSAIAGDMSRARRADGAITKSAGERREAVDGEVVRLRSQALADDDVAEQYVAAVAERGQIDQILGRSGNLTPES